MNTSVLRAVFLRNFISYFTNPTGYLFICGFVFASTTQAFLPAEFFRANLANLDLLNAVFPTIMLVFIPAITMGIWADERRQGTDELLLTIPAGDFEIVLGKYLAAVAIYSASLLFSLVCNLCLLMWLSEWSVDIGLFLGTYFGYGLIGLAMLAIGMVGSFLTSNLTVGWVVGVVLNAPLVFMFSIGSYSGASWLRELKDWSIGGHFHDFGRGLITLSGITYFLAVMAVMLYLSMVLIGRRHWMSGRRLAMVFHYGVRTVSLIALAVAVTLLFRWYDLRLDATTEQLSSLSPKSKQLLNDLETEFPVKIEAFISPEVPESFVQTRLNLLTALDEFQAVGGKKIDLAVHETKRYSKEAELAREAYGITPRQIRTEDRGAFTDAHIFMHVAVSCGMETIDPIYFDRGIPTEYELIRSVTTVAQQTRKLIGVVTTDAPLYGQMNMQTFQPGTNWPIITELEKQYDLERVDLSNPLDDPKKYAALLAVQPSSLGPQQMENLIAAIRDGVPTAVFEDPFSALSQGQIPGTSEPRRAPQQMNPMMGGRQPPPQKCKPQMLFDALGIRFDDVKIVCQSYNPYPREPMFANTPEFVFIGAGAMMGEEVVADDDEEEASEEALANLFNQASPITSGLQQLLMPFPGTIEPIPGASTKLEITDLVRTGPLTGTVEFGMDRGQLMRYGMRGPSLNPQRFVDWSADQQHALAVHIRGKKGDTDKEKKNSDAAEDAGPELDQTTSIAENINVVFVADVDMLLPTFFVIRALGNAPEMGINYKFDNVTFVLNVLDKLAGEEELLAIRKRRVMHRTLSLLEKKTKAAKKEANEERQKRDEQLQKDLTKAQAAMDKKMADLEAREDLGMLEKLQAIALARKVEQAKLTANTEAAQREHEEAMERIKTELNVKTEQVQDEYRFWAVALPPIPPLILAFAVFLIRRVRESEGVAQTRLR